VSRWWICPILMSAKIQSADFMPPPVVKEWQKRAITAAIPLTIAAAAGWAITLLHPGDNVFYRAYLLGYMWVLGLALGSLALLMLYHTTGGAWGTVIRRQLEAATQTLWALAIGFVPLLIGIHRLYPWAQDQWLANHTDVQPTATHYLNVPFFLLRAVIYFVAWIALAAWLNKVSNRQDRESGNWDKPLRHVSGVGLLIYALTVTFATVDWLMSLSAPWVSSIYGFLILAGQALISLSFAVIILAGLTKYAPMKDVVKPDQVLDHGKLLLAFTMLWGWFTLSQWLIIWAGNLPDEISWYLDRFSPGWHAFAWFIVMGQFFLPFFILLSRAFKTRSQKLEKLAIFIIFMRYWDLFWYLMPNFHKQEWGYSWQYAVVPLAMLSGWLALYFYYLNRRPLLVLQDDHVKLVLENHHEFERA
jgi:hypothetical protein